MGRHVGGDVGAQPDNSEVAEADLASPAEQHREADADHGEDQHEREKELVAGAVEVRHLGPHQGDGEGADGQPRAMVADQAGVA